MSTDVYSKKLNFKKLEDSDYFMNQEEYLDNSITIEGNTSLFSDSKNENENNKTEKLKKSEELNNNQYDANLKIEKASSNHENTDLLNQDQEKDKDQPKEPEEEKKNTILNNKRNKLKSILLDYNKTEEDPQCLVKKDEIEKLVPIISSKIILDAKKQNNNPHIPSKNYDTETTLDNPRNCTISEDSISQVNKVGNFIPYFSTKISDLKKDMLKLKDININKKLHNYNLSDIILPHYQRNLCLNCPVTNHKPVETRFAEFEKNKQKKIEMERKKLHIQNFSDCTFTPNIKKQEKDNELLLLYSLKHNNNFKIDNNIDNNIKYKNGQNYHEKSKKQFIDTSRVVDRLYRISSMKNTVGKRAKCYSANQMMLNENKFTPKILDRSKLMLRLEGIENILYNDAKRRQKKQIEIQFLNNSPKITKFRKPNKNKNNEENLIKNFYNEFNYILLELKINTDQLDKNQFNMVLNRLGITDSLNDSKKLFEEAWILLNNKSNKISNSNIFQFFAIIFGSKPEKTLGLDLDSSHSTFLANTESLGKLKDKGDYITTYNEKIRVKSTFKSFFQNYVKKFQNPKSKIKKGNSLYVIDINKRTNCMKDLASSSFKLFETSNEIKEKINKKSKQKILNSTLNEFKIDKGNDISKNRLNLERTENLVNSSRKMSLKINQIKKSINQSEHKECTFCPQIISKKEDNINKISKPISPKFNNVKNLVDSNMRFLEKYRKDCPFKPITNNYKKLDYSPSLPKNATFQIERIRKANEEKNRIRKATERIEGSTAFKIGKGWNNISKSNSSQQDRKYDLQNINKNSKKSNTELIDTKNNSTSKQSKIPESLDLSDSNSFQHQDEDKILFFIDVLIGPNIKERLMLKEGESIKKNVDEFALKYALDDEEKNNLIKMINSKVEGVLDSIVEESKTYEQNY